MRASLRVALVALLLLSVLGPVAQAEDDRFAIVAFVVDGSRSIRPGEFDAVKYGLSDAIMEEMGSDPLHIGRVEVMVIQFGIDPGVDPTQVRVELSPIVVNGSTRNLVRDTIRGMEQGFGDTPTAEGIRLATQLITASSNFDRADRIIINVITDGQPHDPTNFPADDADDTQARTDALAASSEAQQAGVDELDTEAVGGLGDRPWQLDFFMDLAFPPEPVLYGLGDPTPDVGTGFVYTIGSAYDFQPPIDQKLRAPFPTYTITATPTDTATPTPTDTPTPTETLTPTEGPSLTPTDTLTPTNTLTPAPVTLTPTLEPTPEAVPEGDSGTLLLLGLIVLFAYGGMKMVRQGGGQRPV